MRLPAAAIAAFVAAHPVQGDPAAITAALDHFQSSCALALSDPDTYIATLTIPGPAGEDVLYPSEDGRYLVVHTAQAEGLTDFAEFAEFAGHAMRRCAVSAVVPGFPEASAITAILKPMLDGRASSVVGGMTRQVAPMWEPGDAPFAFEGDPWFVYHATGLLPGSEAVASVTVQLGGLRFAAEQVVAASEVMQ